MVNEAESWASLFAVVDLCLGDARAFGLDVVAPKSDEEMAAAAQHADHLDGLAKLIDGNIAEAAGAANDSDDSDDEQVAHAKRLVTTLVSTSALLEACFVATELCCVCRLRRPSAFAAPCGHEHCVDCFATLLRTATKDTSLLPLKCCRMPWDMAAVGRVGALSPTELQALNDRAKEKLSAQPLYCPNSACAVGFVGRRFVVGTTAVCPGCQIRICAECSARAHEGSCLEAAEDEALLELGGREGWQRCPRCRRMIELVQGCNHMTCTCGAEFCYDCAARWKTCKCPIWDEMRVLAVAQLRLGELAPAREVRRLAVQLRDRDECEHEGRWRRVEFHERRRRCEHCNRWLYIYTLQCRHCLFQACEECRGRRI
ncbi:IBR domain protein [Achlya hypogyna]|uniref:IBR domain protein n=1 Tax=Achlya hypogyna TaxID=1202772 RepID=A0A1V9ZKY7_ACHHY|nr:IBR domain protein [Achlya hypogyna]